MLVFLVNEGITTFPGTLGTWVEEFLLKRLHQASCFSIMADECTDVATIEEMSVFCRWEEEGSPEEHFLEIVHLKQANAESIYSALVECLKEKNLQVSKIVGMGFDGASTFSGKKTGVQTRIKKLAPHALFVHCHCHLLQLACVQAANSINGIKHVYVLEVLPLLPNESGVSQNGPTSASPSRVEDCQTFRYTMAGT